MLALDLQQLKPSPMFAQFVRNHLHPHQGRTSPWCQPLRSKGQDGIVKTYDCPDQRCSGYQCGTRGFLGVGRGPQAPDRGAGTAVPRQQLFLAVECNRRLRHIIQGPCIYAEHAFECKGHGKVSLRGGSIRTKLQGIEPNPDRVKPRPIPQRTPSGQTLGRIK